MKLFIEQVRHLELFFVINKQPGSVRINSVTDNRFQKHGLAWGSWTDFL